MEKYICIHGHYYQPPRENPWLDEVEQQDSAYPFHDWNDRISEECYAPCTASRILDSENRIVNITNLYRRISFDFGPTLLGWLQRHRPDVYDAILRADRRSCEEHSGHGSAMAQVYNHMIMPLASRRDKVTQVRWGIADFKRRFERNPEGMWLPETAADMETLEVLAEHDIIFTILAPRQARRVRRLSESKWIDVSGGKVDPTVPYTCRLPSGREITIFFYDGPVAQDVAFGGLLRDGARFAGRLLGAFPSGRKGPALVSIATDGETYGHHFRGGDMALAFCLHHIESGGLAKLTNYGEFLALHPPQHEVEIFENSSWSCVHGIERWRKHCGCSTGANSGWSQAWRKGLREGMDWLRDALAEIYEREAAIFLRDVWEARDGYIAVLNDRSRGQVENFLQKHSLRPLSPPEKARALKLLEMQKNAQLVFTSCGWFFDDISGIETVQVMRYASQAIQYVKELDGTALEKEFLAFLEEAPGNQGNNGADVYQSSVIPAMTDHLRVGAHFGMSSLFKDYPETSQIYCYSCTSTHYERREAGRVTLVTGRVKVRSDLNWDENNLSFAVLHLGDQNINCGVRKYVGKTAYEEMRQALTESFDKGDVTTLIRLIDRHFRPHSYTLWHLFRDEQRKILDEILRLTYEDIESSYRQIYEAGYPLMNYLSGMDIPLPRPLLVAAEYIANREIRETLENHPLDRKKLRGLVGDITRWSLTLDTEILHFLSGARVTKLLEEFREKPNELKPAEDAGIVLDRMQEIGVKPNLWKAQNIFFAIARDIYPEKKKRAAEGEEEDAAWIEVLRDLGDHLQIRLP